MKQKPISLEQAVQLLLEDHRRLFNLACPHTTIPWSSGYEVKKVKAALILAKKQCASIERSLLRFRVLLSVMDNSTDGLLRRGYLSTDADVRREWVAATAAIKVFGPPKGKA